MDEGAIMLARGNGQIGEVALRRRADPDLGRDVHELIVNGVFIMDSFDTSTEERLAAETARLLPSGGRVLVGGLGLGSTVAALLAEPGVGRLDVVEIEPLVVDWLRTGLVPDAAGVLDDPRVSVEIGDVQEVVRRTCAAYDGIILDVDNGPGFLVHDGNRRIYEAGFLRACRKILNADGVLAVWSAAAAPRLQNAMREVLGDCHDIELKVRRYDRRFDYHLYMGRKVAQPTPGGPTAEGRGAAGAPAARTPRRPHRTGPGEVAPHNRP